MSLRPRAERGVVRKSLTCRLRSSILETSKSRGLNSESPTSKRTNFATQPSNCISEPLTLRIKPLEFDNKSKLSCVACSCLDGYAFDIALSLAYADSTAGPNQQGASQSSRDAVKLGSR